LKNDPSYEGGVISCDLRSGTTRELDHPADGDVAFSRPAVAVAGATVAYGASVNGADGGSSTYVRVLDATQDSSPVREIETELKVGSVVVRERGAVAWISCEVRFADSPPTSRAPECVGPGALDRVYRASARGRPRVLDKGRDIDPDTLRLRGTRLSWRSGGQTRTARMR
jgi:hypothetical protein